MKHAQIDFGPDDCLEANHSSCLGHAFGSLVPRPHPQKEEKGLVNLGRILGPSLAPRTCGYVIGMHLGIQLMASRAWGASLECI